MSRKSFYLACVIAAVPASARDAGTALWTPLATARTQAVTGGLQDFDLLVTAVAAVAVVIGLAWRRL